jgi:hypothetical protein
MLTVLEGEARAGRDNILAGMDANHMAQVQVQVASIQTLSSRYMRGDKDLPHADIVFIDEAHHSRARTYQAVIDAYPEASETVIAAEVATRSHRYRPSGTSNVAGGRQICVVQACT